MIMQLHNYNVPEIIAVSIESVGEKYRGWLSDELNSTYC